MVSSTCDGWLTIISALVPVDPAPSSGLQRHLSHRSKPIHDTHKISPTKNSDIYSHRLRKPCSKGRSRDQWSSQPVIPAELRYSDFIRVSRDKPVEAGTDQSPNSPAICVC